MTVVSLVAVRHSLLHSKSNIHSHRSPLSLSPNISHNKTWGLTTRTGLARLSFNPPPPSDLPTLASLEFWRLKMSPPPYSNPNTPELAGTRKGMSITTNGRPSTAFVLAFFGSLLLVSAILCCVVYVWRKRALAAADLEASRLAQETAVAKRQEELEYQELDEKLLGQTGLSFKPLVLGTTNSEVRRAAYKSLALPLFVRNKKGHDGTVSQVTRMNERPRWMPRSQWIKRSAMSYKRASTSNIAFSLCRRHQEVAATVFKSSASCPGGFQKHQVRLLLESLFQRQNFSEF